MIRRRPLRKGFSWSVYTEPEPKRPMGFRIQPVEQQTKPEPQKVRRPIGFRPEDAR